MIIMSSQQCLRTHSPGCRGQGRTGREHSLALTVHPWYRMVVLTEQGQGRTITTNRPGSVQN